MSASNKPQILVLAGTNGAGKSSIAGEFLRRNNGEYFNPDEATLSILKNTPEMSASEANSLAWNEGKRLLKEAIQSHQNYAFETTLGGNTITKLLKTAANSGLAVSIWYTGLDSPEKHIERVKLRVEKGGHDIPEDKIRERFENSRKNLTELIPFVTKLKLFDNSLDADPDTGIPNIRLLIEMKDGKIVNPSWKELEDTPKWAKPIATAVMKRHLSA